VADSARITFSWQTHPGGTPTPGLRELGRRILGAVGVGGEVSVLVCSDATIQSLNRQFRRKDHATDVLSFPSGEMLPEGSILLGDVAISLETARRQAGEAGVSLQHELGRLLLHGILHLCGYDHEADDGEMERMEGQLRQELLS
jgi:probable rRNA maturation factor